MKILITGGTGLVGSALKNNIDKKYETVFMSRKDCDLTNYDETLNYFEKIKPMFVIHLAACVGGLYKNMNNKVEMLEKNMLINYNVLKSCYECNVEKVISCLSTCIFPDKITYPIDESMLHNGAPHNSNDAYAYSKRLLEIHSKTYQNQFNKKFICIIPTNIYGENDNYSLEDGHVIPSLIHKCYISKEKNKKFIVKGSGKPLRQFIYSDDLAKLIMLILERYDKKESIILSVSEKDEITIKDVAMLIAKKYNYLENMEFNTSYSDGQYKKTANNKKLMDFLEENNINFQFTNIKDGIEKSIDWFINNFDKSRK